MNIPKEKEKKRGKKRVKKIYIYCVEVGEARAMVGLGLDGACVFFFSLKVGWITRSIALVWD